MPAYMTVKQQLSEQPYQFPHPASILVSVSAIQRILRAAGPPCLQHAHAAKATKAVPHDHPLVVIGVTYRRSKGASAAYSPTTSIYAAAETTAGGIESDFSKLQGLRVASRLQMGPQQPPEVQLSGNVATLLKPGPAWKGGHSNQGERKR